MGGKWRGESALGIDDFGVPVTLARSDEAGVVEHEPEGLVIGARGDLAVADIVVGHGDELFRIEALDAVEIFARALCVILKYRGEEVDYLLVGLAEQLLELDEDLVVGGVEDALVFFAELHMGELEDSLHVVTNVAAGDDVLVAVARHKAHEQVDEAAGEDGVVELIFLVGGQRLDGHAGVEAEGQVVEVAGLGLRGVERCPYVAVVVEGVALHVDQHEFRLHRTGVGLGDEDVAHLGLLEVVGEALQLIVVEYLELLQRGAAAQDGESCFLLHEFLVIK